MSRALGERSSGAEVVARAAHRPMTRLASSGLARGAVGSLAISGGVGDRRASARRGGRRGGCVGTPAGLVCRGNRAPATAHRRVLRWVPLLHAGLARGRGWRGGSLASPSPSPSARGNARILDVRYCGPDKSARAGSFAWCWRAPWALRGPSPRGHGPGGRRGRGGGCDATPRRQELQGGPELVRGGRRLRAPLRAMPSPI